MKKILPAFVMLCLLQFPAEAQQDEKFQQLLKNFVTEYTALGIPPLRLGYVENLNSTGDQDFILEQKQFFKKYLNELFAINPNQLSKEERLDYLQLRYEISMNWERLNLENVYRNALKDAEISEAGLTHVPLGEHWYIYFLKRWNSVETNPTVLMELGRLEIENVQLEIQEIQKDLGYESDSAGFYNFLNSRQFFVDDNVKILKTFQQKKDSVNANLTNAFFDYATPDVAIELAPPGRMENVPGYYSATNQTFYFNVFDGGFNTRDFDWLYIHEAIPGHHFQFNIEASHVEGTEFRALFQYPAYREGWAAYCEEIGKEIGLYQNSFDYLGKLEWDLVRSVRVVLDIGLNYYGWTDEEALRFWKENIVNQDQIAMREIERMKRWPAQVLTYKIGAARILELREKMEQQLGDEFDIKDFHDKILKTGPVPLSLLENYILD